MVKELMALMVFTLFSVCVSAQKKQQKEAVLELTYMKMIGKDDNNKWESWPKQWENNKEHFVPTLRVRKQAPSKFRLEIYFGGSSSGIFVYDVVYSQLETDKVRKRLKNENIYVYKSLEMDDIIWTENFSLEEILDAPQKWETIKNAKFYTWEHTLGSASVYKAK